MVLASLLLSLLQAPPSPQGLGRIHGRVELRHDPGGAVTRPEISELGTPTPHDMPDRRQAIVYLEVAPTGAFEGGEGERVLLDQRNESFVPHILAITAGTTVDFRNSDKTYHNVFSLSKARSFDLGRYATGASKSVKFDRPGIVRVFCEIHSHMSAFILVFAHRYFCVTSSEGDYHIDSVPPGTYTLSVWHPTLTGEPRTVTIPPGGGDITLDLTL